MDYTQASVDALANAVTDLDRKLKIANQAMSDASEASMVAMQAVANLEQVAPPKPARKAYLGASDFSDLSGTNPTCHRIYYGLTGNGFVPQVALQKAQDDAKNNRLTLISIGPGSIANQTKPDLNALSAFYPALKANPNTIFIPWHEPEDDKVTPAVWNAYCKSLVTEVRKNTTAKTAFVLMAWTARPGGPVANWLNAMDKSLYDYAGFDSYNNARNGTKDEPGSYHNECLKIAKDMNKPLVITETGQDNNQGDPALFWDNTVAWTQNNPEVYAIAWWPQKGPNGDHTPTPGSKSAFQKALNSEPFNNVKGGSV